MPRKPFPTFHHAVCGGLSVLAMACGAAGATVQSKSSPARESIVAVDLSGSRSATELAEGQRFTTALVNELRNGDKFVLLEVYENGLRHAPRQWSDTVAAAADPNDVMPSELAYVAKVRKAAMQVLPLIFASDSAGKVAGTDIFSTLVRVSDYAHAEQRVTTLYLLSDMLQAAKGVNMEHPDGVPDDRWLADQKAAGVLPQLNHVCIVVVGADPSTEHGARVRAFWKKYFALTGAQLSDENYRNSVDDPRTVGCNANGG